MTDCSISKRLRTQYDDLVDLYSEAKQTENAPLMEKLAKSTASLAKQVKEHEIHERESLSRTDVKRICNMMGIVMGQAIKRYFPDDERTNMAIDLIREKLITMSEDREL